MRNVHRLRHVWRIATASLFFFRASSIGAQPKVDRLPSDLQMAAVNVAIGAATAAVWRAASHRPIIGGTARGALAGLAVFTGKRIITEGRPGYWWIGREITAIASSEIANAAQNRPVLSKAVLPLGPVRLHVDRLSGKVEPRLDVASSVVAAVMMTREGHSFALRESLATGAIVFFAPETTNEIGQSIGGVMTVSELAADGVFDGLQSKRRVIAHELVHTSQQDFVFNAWSDAAQEVIVSKVPALAGLGRYLDFNLTLPFQFLANSMIEYKDRPWEQEAKAIARRTP